MTIDSVIREIISSEMSNFMDLILNKIEDFFCTLEIRESTTEDKPHNNPNTGTSPVFSPSNTCVGGVPVPNYQPIPAAPIPDAVVQQIEATIPAIQTAIAAPPVQTGPIKYPPSNESKEFNHFIAVNNYIVKDRKKTLDVLQRYLPESIRTEQYATPLVWLNPADYEKIKQDLIMGFNGVS